MSLEDSNGLASIPEDVPEELFEAFHAEPAGMRVDESLRLKIQQLSLRVPSDLTEAFDLQVKYNHLEKVHNDLLRRYQALAEEKVVLQAAVDQYRQEGIMNL